LVAAGSSNVGVQPYFLRAPYLFSRLCEPIHIAESFGDTAHTLRRLRVGLDAIVNTIAIDRHLVKQTRTGRKIYPCVSVSVIGIRRAAGNGLGRGRPTRERGQWEQLNGTRPYAGTQGAKRRHFAQQDMAAQPRKAPRKHISIPEPAAACQLVSG